MKLFRRLLSLTLALLLVCGVAIPGGFTARALESDQHRPPGHEEITGISINTEPAHTEYKQGDKLSLDGLTVKLHYGDDSSNIVNFNKFEEYGITASPADGTELSEPGKHEVKVSLDKLNASFEISVEDKAEEIKVSGISINTLPQKTEYNTGDKLSLEGLTVKVIYSDGSDAILGQDKFEANGITVTPAQGSTLETEGKTAVKVSLGSFSDSFEISVTKANTEVIVEKLTINTLPEKTAYIVGDKLDLSGLTVKLHYSDGASNIFVPAEFADKDIIVKPAEGDILDAEGKVTATVTHGQLTESFEITVAKANTDIFVSNITVNTPPAKTEYIEGERLDLSGLTVKLHYSDGESNIFVPAEFADKDIVVKPAEGDILDAIGTVTATVTYGELSDTFELKVTEAEKDREFDRIFGSDRYETALAISSKGWEKAETVIIASGEDFADALAGATISKALNAPILLMSGGDNTHVLAEIERLGASNAIILGGVNAVSAQAESQLKAMKLNIERLSGSDRYATATAIALKLNELGVKADKAFIVSGESFADALSAGYAAAMTGSPILYTTSDRLNQTTAAHISENGIGETIIIGGPAAVSEAVAGELGKLGQNSRIGGENRYLTSLAVARLYFDHTASDSIAFATGENYPDALTGGAYALKLGVPVLLADEKADEELVKYLNDCGIERVILFGGENALSEDFVQSIK